MNIKVMCCSILSGLVILSSAAFAHDNMSVDDKVNKMKSDLNLTADQANAVRPIIQDYKDKMQQIMQDKEQKLSNVLTPDQMNKLKSIYDSKNNQ